MNVKFTKTSRIVNITASATPLSEFAVNVTDYCERICFRKEDFHISFTKPFLTIFVCALVIAELICLASDQNSIGVLVVILPSLVFVLCSLLIGFLCLRLKFEVGPDGIDCVDMWYRSHCGWEEISQFKLISLFGLSYLKVAVAQDRAMWVPLFVNRSEKLEDLLLTYTHDDPRLTKALGIR